MLICSLGAYDLLSAIIIIAVVLCFSLGYTVNEVSTSMYFRVKIKVE